VSFNDKSIYHHYIYIRVRSYRPIWVGSAMGLGFLLWVWAFCYGFGLFAMGLGMGLKIRLTSDSSLTCNLTNMLQTCTVQAKTVRLVTLVVR